MNLRLSFYRNVDPGLLQFISFCLLQRAYHILCVIGKIFCGESHGRTICIRGRRIRLYGRRRCRSPDMRRDIVGA